MPMNLLTAYAYELTNSLFLWTDEQPIPMNLLTAYAYELTNSLFLWTY